MITRLDIFSDLNPDTPATSILFTDAGKAEDWRLLLLGDDGLFGIARIRVVTVPTDEAAVAEFYKEVNSE